MAVLSRDTTINNKKVLPLRHSARFVIGTSTAGHTLRDCDYLCDGVDDQVEINQALSDLPDTGGKIIILDGTYNITAPINIAKNSTTLSGNGSSTVLKRMWDSTEYIEGMIGLFSKNGCIIQNLYLDGNKSSFNSSDNIGIYLYGSSNNTITENICNDNSSHNIYLTSLSNNNTITGNTCNNNYYGINLSNSSNNNITGNTCNNSNYGIYLYNSSSNNTITGNTCNNNSDTGIRLNSASNNNTITGNTCDNNRYGIYLDSSSNNTISGNTCNNNSYYGIYLYKPSNNNTITGNTCNNNSYGVYLNSSPNNNTISGNTCNNNNYGVYLSSSSSSNTIIGNTCIRGTGLASDYTSSHYTIRLQNANNNYNLIAYNNIMGKNYFSGGGTSNTFTGNKYN